MTVTITSLAPPTPRVQKTRHCCLWAWLIALSLMPAIGSGCRSSAGVPGAPRELAYAPGECPRFLMVYLPYQQNGSPLAAATPDTHGWTDQRMARDITRLQELGMDGLVLGLQPAVFSDPVASERLIHFADLVDQSAKGSLELVLLLIPPSPSDASIDAATVGQWIASNGLRQRRLFRQLDGRTMVLAPPGITLTGAPHPAFAAVYAESPDAPWTWGECSDPRRLVPTGADRQVLVYAGWRGRTRPVDEKGRARWELPRNRGATLGDELAKALAAGARTICISSWNNFVAGDFVEPNSLDGDRAVRVLAKAVRRVKEACQNGAAEPGGTALPR